MLSDIFSFNNFELVISAIQLSSSVPNIVNHLSNYMKRVVQEINTMLRLTTSVFVNMKIKFRFVQKNFMLTNTDLIFPFIFYCILICILFLINQNSNKDKYIISEVMNNGLANRINCISSSLLISILTRRKLLSILF